MFYERHESRSKLSSTRVPSGRRQHFPFPNPPPPPSPPAGRDFSFWLWRDWYARFTSCKCGRSRASLTGSGGGGQAPRKDLSSDVLYLAGGSHRRAELELVSWIARAIINESLSSISSSSPASIGDGREKEPRLSRSPWSGVPVAARCYLSKAPRRLCITNSPHRTTNTTSSPSGARSVASHVQSQILLRNNTHAHDCASHKHEIQRTLISLRATTSSRSLSLSSPPPNRNLALPLLPRGQQHTKTRISISRGLAPFGDHLAELTHMKHTHRRRAPPRDLNLIHRTVQLGTLALERAK